MQPKPSTETSSPLLPSLRIFIILLRTVTEVRSLAQISPIDETGQFERLHDFILPMGSERMLREGYNA